MYHEMFFNVYWSLEAGNYISDSLHYSIKSYGNYSLNDVSYLEFQPEMCLKYVPNSFRLKVSWGNNYLYLLLFVEEHGPLTNILYPGQSFPVSIHSFDACFWFSIQCVLWSFPFLLRIPGKRLPNDAVCWFAQCMSCLLLKSCPNFLSNWDLVCSLTQ